MVQNNEKWEISDFIPPLSDKMFFEYEIEMTDNDAERMKKNIEILRENGLPYDEKMEVSISEKNVKIHKKWDIIRRVVAIVATRLAAETYLEKKENGKKENRKNRRNNKNLAKAPKHSRLKDTSSSSAGQEKTSKSQDSAPKSSGSGSSTGSSSGSSSSGSSSSGGGDSSSSE